MKRKIFILLSLLLVTMSASSQRVRFNLTFRSTVPAELSKVYIQPLNAGDETNAQPLRLKDGVYTASIPASTSGFYELVLVINNGQWMSTVYMAAGRRAELVVEFDGSSIVECTTGDNRALSLLNSHVSASNRKMWLTPDLSDDELKSIVTECLTLSDSIIGTVKPSAAVADYLRAWAYTAAQDLYSMISRAQNRKAPFAKEEVLPSVGKDMFDNERAILIPSVKQMIFAEVTTTGAGELDEMLSVLYDWYKCKVVRLTIADKLMSRFLVEYNYAQNFDAGLEYLRKVVKDFDLPKRYVDDYLKHKAMLIGADFPDNVVLVDSEGHKVNFSKFKGKYVYVDFWASWCAPCCREVPYLQALEKELEGSDVVCVSISADTDVEEWKAKMTELGMHGNQLFDRDGELCNMMNIGGIPFFVIYDKEGKLHTYGAMRPSTGAPLKQFLLDLK